jgi:hypothetical protein
MAKMVHDADDKAFDRYVQNLWLTAPEPVAVSEEDAEHAVSFDDVPDEAPAELVRDDPVLNEIFEDVGALYKIEIRLGSKRKTTWVTAKIDLWHSGRYFAGEGDDHMFICSYPDCAAPIPSDCVEGDWVICPTCRDKERNHGGLQAASAEAAGYKLDKEATNLIPATKHRQVKTRMGFSVPCVRDCLLVAAQPDQLADILATYWQKFEGKADIYLKHHPEDIRHTPGKGTFRPVWDKKDALVIYAMEDIVKDTLAGANIIERFKALLTA